MTIITKTFAAEVKTDGDGLGPDQFRAIISAPTLDRDGEIVDALAFAPLPKRISVDIDHSMKVLDVVGSGPPSYLDDGSLSILGDWADTDKAADVRKLVKGGHVNAMSITFRAAQREVDQNDGLLHIRKGELLNVAFVVIPSNREAAVLGSKAADHDAPLAARLEAVESELDQLKGAVAQLFAKSFTGAPEDAPATAAADVSAVEERAAARQRTAEKARAVLARTATNLTHREQ